MDAARKETTPPAPSASRARADPALSSLKPTAIVAGLIVLVVVFLLVTTHGKSCHYNVHFSKRLVCTDDAH